MKNIKMIVVLVFAVSLTAAQTTRKNSGEAKVEQALMQMERDWSAAYLKHDTAVIERILADDYVGIDGRGVVTNKAQETEEAKAPAPGAPTPDRMVADESVSDMKVRVYGNAAIVTGITTEKVLFKGKESTVRYRRTTVYVNRQGNWKCVSFHGSRILESGR